MDNLKRYCPKCGSEVIYSLTTHHLYRCSNASCDYFLDSENTIDIGYKAKGIQKALSNFCPYPFKFSGLDCASMESFIQSLKVNKGIVVQKDICSKPGPFCYSIREMLPDWRKDQIVYWCEKPYIRRSDDYTELLRRAYFSLYNQSPLFRYALKESKPYRLIHSIGSTDKTETLLTPDEYISILDWLRNLPQT